MRARSGESVPHKGLRDIEEMWGALLSGGWLSLAVVPTDHGVSVQEVVDSLEVAMAAFDSPVHRIDARGTEVAEAKRLAQDLAASVASRTRTVVLVDSLTRSLAGVHLVKGVDAVLLVVTVGAMDRDALASTVAMIGPERILGSVTAPVTG